MVFVSAFYLVEVFLAVLFFRYSRTNRDAGGGIRIEYHDTGMLHKTVRLEVEACGKGMFLVRHADFSQFVPSNYNCWGRVFEAFFL